MIRILMKNSMETDKNIEYGDFHVHDKNDVFL